MSPSPETIPGGYVAEERVYFQSARRRRRILGAVALLLTTGPLLGLVGLALALQGASSGKARTRAPVSMAQLGRDLKSARWIHLKGWLFLVIGILAGTGLWLDSPKVRTGVLLCLCVWGFCRFYYYAFYVIEKYTDPQYKFAGLLDFVVYLMRSRKG